MSSVRRAVLTVALGVTIGAGPAVVSPAQAAPRPRELATIMTGRQEVPGPGDTNAWGAANVRVWPKTGRICYTLYVSGVDGDVNRAHLHAGRRGVTGPPIAALDAPVHGWSRGCGQITGAEARKLARSPGGYYVNVHSTSYPDGAVRGQLWVQGRGH